MVDTTIGYELNNSIEAMKPRKGRPKMILTEQEIQDRLEKKREYYRNYQKHRKENDESFVQRRKEQRIAIDKKYRETHKEQIKQTNLNRYYETKKKLKELEELTKLLKESY
jgi:hypothetical protein